MRAALLPAGGDPFLLAYWLRHFRTWADEVDELRLAVCGQPDPVIRAYLRTRADQFGSKVILTFHPRTDHGAMIGWLLSETQASHVMLCEDDAFVRRPGAVSEHFRMIEEGATDLVGCPRATGTGRIIEAADLRFGVQSAPVTAEAGPLFWPCFLFARRSDLLRTDGDFSAKGRDSEAILGVTFTEEQALDTFGYTSLQLRALGLRVTVRAQYRAQRDLMADWVTDAPWFHVGGLSAGYGLYLIDGVTEEARRRHWDSIRNDIYDWDKRMAWWQRLRDCWDGALPEHHAAYAQAIDDYLAGTGMSQSNVDIWRAGFDRLVTWAE